MSPEDEDQDDQVPRPGLTSEQKLRKECNFSKDQLQGSISGAQFDPDGRGALGLISRG
jgi:hypothetical protein